MFKQQNINFSENATELIKFLKIFVWVVLLFYTIKLVSHHYNIIVYPNPLDYREGANVQTTYLLLHSQNPFSIENQPQCMQSYGIFYSLVCLPFAEFFGPNLLVHRAISGIFIILSCFIILLLSKRRKISLLLTYSVILLWYSTLLYNQIPISRPDSLGLFLFLLSLYIPYHYDYSYKSLIISIFICVLLFFTKTFYLLVFPYLASYLFLFQSKKKGIIYCLLAIAILVPIVLIVNMFLRLYLLNCFLGYFNFPPSLISFHSVHVQLLFYFKSLKFIIIIPFILTIYILLIKNHEIKSVLLNRNFLKVLNQRLNIFNINEPLIRYKIYCNYYYLFCSFIAFYFLVGRNAGTWMNYLYELVSPFLFISILELSKYNYKIYLLLLIAIILNINLFYKILPKYDSNYGRKEWDIINNVIKKNNKIFNSPAVVPIMIENRKPIYDNGLSESFPYCYTPIIIRKYHLFDLTDSLIAKRKKDFALQIIQSIKRKEFDVLILANWQWQLLYFYANDSILNKYYFKDFKVQVTMPQTGQTWKLTVWKPK